MVTISSGFAITASGVARFYLRLTLVMDGVELTLVLVIREGLRLGECLDATAVGRNGPAETSSRTFAPNQR